MLQACSWCMLHGPLCTSLGDLLFQVFLLWGNQWATDQGNRLSLSRRHPAGRGDGDAAGGRCFPRGCRRGFGVSTRPLSLMRGGQPAIVRRWIADISGTVRAPLRPAADLAVSPSTPASACGLPTDGARCFGRHFFFKGWRLFLSVGGSKRRSPIAKDVRRGVSPAANGTFCLIRAAMPRNAGFPRWGTKGNGLIVSSGEQAISEFVTR
jgi:hypothetical protein